MQGIYLIIGFIVFWGIALTMATGIILLIRRLILDHCKSYYFIKKWFRYNVLRIVIPTDWLREHYPVIPEDWKRDFYRYRLRNIKRAKHANTITAG